MKKIWLGIGAAVIIILLLLQTKFNTYLRVEDSGYAISGNAIKEMLIAGIEEEKDSETIPYYRFEALDYIYKRGSSFYMGENKKTEVDLSFPFYINGDAGIMFMENSGTLFDVEFKENDAYQGLTVSERISYNPGGERADATEYLFCRLTNGLFINLDQVAYQDRNEQREIAMNSIIYFKEGYFTYCEPNDGTGVYQACRKMDDSDIITINNTSYTYRDLLLKLHVISEKKEKSEKKEEEKPEFLIPETVVDDRPGEQAEVSEEQDKTEKDKDEDQDKATVKKEKEAVQKAERPEASQSQQKPPSGEKAKQPSRPPRSGNGGSANQGGSRGVRPDSMRPDKQPSTGGTQQPDPEYQKPSVKVTSQEEGVYRLMVTVKIDDPARRLHPLRKVQFEFYEVDHSGKETLAFRTYTGSSQIVTAGNGAIKPDTQYRVNAYFTYYDEYDQTVVESLLDTTLHTKSYDALGSVALDDRDIEVFYDNRLELPHVKYLKGVSDEEAVYGINRSGGLLLTVSGKGTQLGFHAVTNIDALEIRNFKNGMDVLLKSMPNLKANSEYSYKIEAIDYFGKKIELINNTGEFITCKSRPVGELEIVQNKIGDFKMKVTMSDPDKSAILGDNSGNYNIYLVFCSEKNMETSPITKQECDKYIENDGKVDGGRIYYAYKFTQEEYKKYISGSDTEYEISIDGKVIAVNSLELNRKYYAYLFCDYNLNNGAGNTLFGEITNLAFTAASLSSLGNIYVNADISNITAHSAVIMYTLNTERTNDVLESLLSDVKFEIIRGNGAEAIKDSFIEFDPTAMATFSGYDHLTEPPKKVQSGSVSMDASFFSGQKEGQNPLKSMTDYTIEPTIWATYNGIKYPMNVTLTQSTFKTLREPAQVEVTDLLLAAGTLRFNVKVTDTDEAITGNSGHKVVMNLYQQDGTFVKALRIPKNTDDAVPVEIKNLDPKAKFKLTFIAVEYNEGYTNATFESNKILKELLLSDSIDLSGTIKLYNIAGYDSKRLCANTKVTLADKDKVLQNLPYFVQVKKNGVDITGSAGYPAAYTIGTGDYDTSNRVIHDKSFLVDKGDNTYTLVLYVIINGQILELDTLTFTADQIAENIDNAKEFVWKIKNGGGTGKYIITDNISLESDIYYENPDKAGETARPVNLASIFNGTIDFQGYTLSYNYKTNGSSLFSNIGPKGEICNMVFDVKMDNYTSAAYDTGVLCYNNYGRIHDVHVRFKGGAAVANRYFGLLCRINTVSGIIENFAISNAPEDGMMPFTARYECGLLCGYNKGIIRYGYAYGVDIYADVGTPSQSGAIRIGAIAGAQGSNGRIYNVFSLVNVVVPSPDKGTAAVTEYGSVAGNGGGRITSIYGIGQSYYSSVYNNNSYDADIGPVLGTNNSRTSNVYYWNENDITYAKSVYQNRIGLESLNDFSWQASVLGDQFITSNVEVGYYPHVKMSDEMPEQPYIPLPSRINNRLVEILSSTVIEYTDNEQAAVVEFRLSNPRNADIREIVIDNLTTEIDSASVVSEDGFTTLRAKVSSAARFCSAYEITTVKCYINGRIQSVTFNPNPILLVDFYRNIYNAQDWYDYVVCAPTENARLQADIDFTGIAANRINVAKEYKGKLDGNKYRGNTSDNPAGYSIKNITITSSYPNLFANMSGEIKNLCVENITLGTAGTTGADASLIRLFYGVVSNVHLKQVSLTGYGYMGGFAAYSYAISEIQDSSISGISIKYLEPKNTNTTGRIGGMVGYGTEARISNCYVRELNMSVEDIRNCEGAGGIIGFNNYCIIDGAYATGDMSVRGMNVGGIAGYYVANTTDNGMTNVISRVNITGYQDKMGGIIGEAALISVLNSRNNMSGIALGSVFGSNPNAEYVSYTIGSYAGSIVSFYGSQVQLLNGMTGQPKDDNTLDLLTYDQLQNPDTYTTIAQMDKVYDYSKVTKGVMPVLYYAGTTIPLPFQTDTPLSLVHVQNNDLEVRDVGVNKDQRYIYMDLNNPNGYKITGVKIENLKYTFDDISSGKNRIYADYLQESKQEHWQDSYLLTEITYQKVADDNSITIGKADFSDNPVRVPLTMFCDIRDVDTWNKYINPTNNYGNYENYRIVNDISFTGVNPTTNAKIGRLRGGVSSGKAVLSNVNIGPGKGSLQGNNENFIFRLNTELSNIAFKNCSVNSALRDGTGIIGTSAGMITNMEFEGIKIDNRTADKNNVGIIGYQISGKLSDIKLKNIEVGLNGTKQIQVGSFVGFSTGGTLYEDITGENISVKGSGSVGGLVGRTEKSGFDNISFKDIIVTGAGNDYVGGIVGVNASPRTTVNAPCFRNITLTGTPTYDSSGNIIASTTVVGVQETMLSGTNGNYVGGLAGLLYGYANGWEGSASNPAANARPLVVDGIIVKGHGSYIGGAFGRCYDASNTTVKNTLVTTNKTPASLYYYVGGISGYHDYSDNYNVVENTAVDVQNHSNIGLLNGFKANNGAVNYCYVDNSLIKAEKTIAGSFESVGGLVGRSEATVSYSGVMNTNILTSSAIANSGFDYVGGVVGYCANGVNRSFYYAEPENTISPAAKQQYQIVGYNGTGGIVGFHNAGAIVVSYSNANVAGKGHSAGGISGIYQNAYTTATINGNPVYSYSGAGMRYNYFTGTVHANKWAGGAIGRNEMAYSNSVAASHKASGGRSSKADQSGYKSGASNENEYTYMNLILAKSVTSDTAGTAHAFSGYQDGFEGKANGISISKDNTSADKARRTYFWDGMRVGGTTENDTLYLAKNADAPDYAKNSGTYRFKRWNKNEYSSITSENAPSDAYNVRIVSTSDIRNLQMFRALGWLTWTSSQSGHETEWKEANGTYNGLNVKGDYHRFIHSGITSTAVWDALLDASMYKDKDYLPHIRINEKSNIISDYLVSYQSAHRLALPIPVWTPSAQRIDASPFMLRSLNNTYAIIYPVDVDKVNIEFSQNFVDGNGCFMLSYGNQTVDKQLITKRVYTYTYDYRAGLNLQLGVANPDQFVIDMEADGQVYGTDYMLEDIFDYPEEYYWEDGEPIYYKSSALARHVMTYGTKYYYIDEAGIVSGTGSTVKEEAEEQTEAAEDSTEQSKGTRKDPSAQTMAGSYITIYNGKALTKDGQVIEIESGTVLGSAAGVGLLEYPIPLQTFDYDGYKVETYSKFTEIIGSDIVQRETQILKGSTGVMGFVDGMIENVKDSILLYVKDGDSYQTILGDDGIMVDMQQGENINAPEDFKKSGIVYMTNNLNCSAPFVLVEYSNGGVAGYNYMTGEYLFDYSFADEISLLDYIKVYFMGDKSMYAQMSSSYAANNTVAEIAGTADRLFTMVEGNSSGEEIDENSTGDGMKSEHEKAGAAEEGAKTSGVTAMAEGDSDGIKSSQAEEILSDGNAYSFNVVLDSEESQGSGGNGSAFGTDTNTAGRSGVAEGGNDTEKGAMASGEEDGYAGNPPAESAGIVGEGTGNGDLVASGTALGNGAEPGTDGSIGEVLNPDAEVESSLTEQVPEGKESEDEKKKTLGTADDEDESAEDIQNSGKIKETESEADQEKMGEEGNASKASRTSTAGTSVSDTGGGIDNGQKPPQIKSSKEQEDTVKGNSGAEETSTNSGDLITVYNQATGTYEIVDMKQYFSSPAYQSENVKLAIRDMSAYSGYAQEKEEKKHANGLVLYILISTVIAAGVGLTIRYRKKQRYGG